jgi:hypothetical protein
MIRMVTASATRTLPWLLWFGDVLTYAHCGHSAFGFPMSLGWMAHHRFVYGSAASTNEAFQLSFQPHSLSLMLASRVPPHHALRRRIMPPPAALALRYLKHALFAPLVRDLLPLALDSPHGPHPHGSLFWPNVFLLTTTPGFADNKY